MRAWIENLWRTIATGFWFVPGLFLLAGVTLGLLSPWVDHLSDKLLPSHLHISATTARATLTALCGAMFTVTGIVFSTTIVALSITSAQLGPRLLRNFLKQLITQLTLGLSLATSVYCLVLLRQIDMLNGSVFVPHLSLLLASLFSVATLMVIVYFIHRVAHSMQAQNVVSDVANDLDDSIERLFPERFGEPLTDETKQADSASPPPGEHPTDWHTAWQAFDDKHAQEVRARKDGYLQAIADDTLLDIAVSHEATLRVQVQPGDYVRRGDLLLKIDAKTSLDDEATKSLKRAFMLGNSRTPQQDVECAIHELVEIAVRALSPGVNDPFTAITCIDRLSGTLRRLAERKMPSGVRLDDEGKLRLVAKPRQFDDIISAAFDQIRQNGAGSVVVTLRVLQALRAIAENNPRQALQSALRRQADMIYEAAQQQPFVKHDFSQIELAYQELLEQITPVTTGYLSAV